MSKSRKILTLLFCILILTILIPILLDYHKFSGLDFQWRSWKQVPIIGYYLSQYVFWGILILAALIFLVMLIIIFYPKRYLEISLDGKDGHLSLKNSALEGFVQSLLRDHSLIKNPKVRVNTRKNKCRVSVAGEILPSDNIVRRSQAIQEEIASGLNSFFGLSHAVKLEITVSDIQPKKANQRKVSRVK